MANVDSISIVIAWVNPLELIVPGLKSLLEMQDRHPDEIIVVTRHGEEECKRLRALFSGVELLRAPSGTPITALRSMGLREARGSIVSVTEDHCIPGRDWIARIEKWISQGYGVVGGPVENDCTHRWRDWAAFLTEYAGAVRPAMGTVVNGLPGNNVAYRRELIDGLCQTLEGGRWESFYHESLQRQEVRMHFDPDMLVYHRRPFDFWYFIRQRYYFCRAFAGMRGPFRTLLDRCKYGFGSALLPPVLMLRGLGNLIERRRLVLRYLSCLPLIAAYMTVGAFGEMTGYFFGGGDALRRVE